MTITAGCGQPPSRAIIDVHLHAEGVDSYVAIQSDTRWFPQDLKRATSDDELMTESLKALERFNVVRAITSEEIENVERWKHAAPDRIIPALLCMCATPEAVAKARQLVAEGRVDVLGELVWQYAGIQPSDPKVEAVWQLAEELDIPLAIHLGPTPTGWSQTVNPAVRIRNGSPLLLEDALTKHPKARVYVMHAGWPYADEMVAMLYQYPELYVDIAWINWSLPRKEFHGFLRRLVDAGFADRVMFGTDQMQWPESIEVAIDAVESAEFLTDQQKSEIFCGNAADFFRLGRQLCE
jgi:predicted TIM-barrel fold metal-dependent hydrolase